jgi:hypothetical protein
MTLVLGPATPRAYREHPCIGAPTGPWESSL